MSAAVHAGGYPHARSGTIGPVSLVVPVRDEAASLRALLDSIRGQARPPDEVVLVDGGSSDATVTLAVQAARSDPTVRILEAGDATPGRGRNVGIAAACHEWVALTDAGIVLEPQWLADLEAAAVSNPSAGVVWGTYEPRIDNFLDSCATLAYVPARRRTAGGPARGPSITSCLLRRSAWAAAGGFPDLRAAEDLVFMERLAGAGIEAVWAPSAVAWWSLPPSLGATFRRFRSYSCHNVLAGRQAHWHHGVARIYAAAAIASIAALALDADVGAVLGLGVGARVALTVARHRGERSLSWMLNPARLAGVAVLLATLDAATFIGWADALVGCAR